MSLIKRRDTTPGKLAAKGATGPAATRTPWAGAATHPAEKILGQLLQWFAKWHPDWERWIRKEIGKQVLQPDALRLAVEARLATLRRRSGSSGGGPKVTSCHRNQSYKPFKYMILNVKKARIPGTIFETEAKISKLQIAGLISAENGQKDRQKTKP